MTPTHRPSVPAREPLLAWVRMHAPDARIGHAVEGGERVAYALLSYGGEVHELSVRGEDAPDRIVVEAANAIRRRMCLPPLGRESRSRELEGEIVRASVEGRDEDAARLSRELVTRPDRGGGIGRPRWRTREEREGT